MGASCTCTGCSDPFRTRTIETVGSFEPSVLFGGPGARARLAPDHRACSILDDRSRAHVRWSPLDRGWAATTVLVHLGRNARKSMRQLRHALHGDLPHRGSAPLALQRGSGP